jgi:hypothetical protein
LFGPPATVDRIYTASTTENDTVFGILLFFFCEEGGVVDGVWEEEKDQDAPGAGNYTKNLSAVNLLIEKKIGENER